MYDVDIVAEAPLAAVSTHSVESMSAPGMLQERRRAAHHPLGGHRHGTADGTTLAASLADASVAATAEQQSSAVTVAAAAAAGTVDYC